jgi:hypothetical protein
MKSVILLTCLTVALASPLMAQDAKVAGDWTLTMETPQGSSTPGLVLEQAEQKLTGKFVGRMGETPLTGTIKGSAIAFTVKINAQGQEFELAFSGTVDQDSMKGSVDFGGMGSANWTAARKK